MYIALAIVAVVVVGIVLSVIKSKKPGVTSRPDHFDPMKFRPAPSFSAPQQTPDEQAADQSAVDTAKAAAGFNQPQN